MCAGVFEGVRVVEMASWQFVPAAAGVLAEFGADVVKIEPLRGDPQRALTSSGALTGRRLESPSMQQTNRGKRSIAVDPSRADGQDIVRRCCDQADVFMTNLRAPACQRIGIGPEVLRARRSDLVYARGTALGSAGPEAGRPGFDITAYWSRGGVGGALAATAADEPPGQRPGFGDKQGAMNLAFGIAAALVRRSRTGEGALVESSLLSAALWSLSSDIVASRASGIDNSTQPFGVASPLNDTFGTSDGRWLRLQCEGPEEWWRELCERMDMTELLVDPRFTDADARRRNRESCRAELEKVFSASPLSRWRHSFSGASFPWEPSQNLLEVLDDKQVTANDVITDAVSPAGDTVGLVRAPVRFDEATNPLRPAPALGEHTDAVLGELGFERDAIAELRRSGTVA